MRIARRRRACRRLQRRLQTFLDGNASPETADAVARHLGDCEACCGEAAVLCRLIDALRDLGAPPDPGTLERLRAAAASVAARG